MSEKQVKYSVDNPLNREPPVKNLVDNYLTSPTQAYDRNHGPIPYLPTNASETHTITIDGLINATRKTLTVHQLATDFPQHEVICALECAGNRRHTMRRLLNEVQGIDWGDGAVMNCKWRGPRLRDVLGWVGGVAPAKRGKNGERGGGNAWEGLHAAFSCYQVRTQNDDWFGGSVPLERVLGREDGGDVILALEMNDAPLTPKHGYPLRAVLPGIAGSKWVKWLDQITIQDYESTNFYQQRDYKILPENAVDSKSAEPYWGRTPPMYDTPINSVVGVPADGETVNRGGDGTIEVKGYAVPGGVDGPVTRVQVSADKGGNWVDAEMGVVKSKWAWVLWRVDISIEESGPDEDGKREVWTRAFDAGGNEQGEHSRWNLRGVGYNGYGRVVDLTVV